MAVGSVRRPVDGHAIDDVIRDVKNLHRVVRCVRRFGFASEIGDL